MCGVIFASIFLYFIQRHFLEGPHSLGLISIKMPDTASVAKKCRKHSRYYLGCKRTVEKMSDAASVAKTALVCRTTLVSPHYPPLSDQKKCTPMRTLPRMSNSITPPPNLCHCVVCRFSLPKRIRFGVKIQNCFIFNFILMPRKHTRTLSGAPGWDVVFSPLPSLGLYGTKNHTNTREIILKNSQIFC